MEKTELFSYGTYLHERELRDGGRFVINQTGPMRSELTVPSLEITVAPQPLQRSRVVKSQHILPQEFIPLPLKVSRLDLHHMHPELQFNVP